MKITAAIIIFVVLQSNLSLGLNLGAKLQSLKKYLGKFGNLFENQEQDENICKYNEYCRQKKHVACLYNDSYLGPDCQQSDSIKIIKFDDFLIDLTVTKHNEYRNFIASGGNPKFPKAAKMATMSWDATLEKFAELNTRQCSMEHDECRSTKDFNYAGQNLCFTTSFIDPGYQDVIDTITDCLNFWYQEYKDADKRIIQKCCKNPNSLGTVGHFTQMMVDRSNKVGCSLIIYSKDEAEYTIYNSLMACNYASTNVHGFPIYRTKSSAAFECRMGTNPEFPGLCHPDERIDPNSLLV